VFTGGMPLHGEYEPSRDRWWEIAVRAFPPYADYQKKTEREIPVFVLTPKG
jgi:F420H(2)-dependent quinone reductase